MRTWWNPNYDALLDPVTATEHPTEPGKVVVDKEIWDKVLAAAGYIPDTRKESEFDEAAWTEDMKDN